METMLDKHDTEDELASIASSEASTLTSSVLSSDSWSCGSSKECDNASTCQQVLIESNLQASLAEITATEMRQVLDWWNRCPSQDEEEVRDQADDLPGNALASEQDWVHQSSCTTPVAVETQQLRDTSPHEDALAQSFLVDRAIERTREMEIIIQTKTCCGQEDPDQSLRREADPPQASHQAHPLLLQHQELPAPQRSSEPQSPPRTSPVSLFYLAIMAVALYWILEQKAPVGIWSIVQPVFVIYLSQSQLPRKRLLLASLFLLPAFHVICRSSGTVSIHGVHIDDERICVEEM